MITTDKFVNRHNGPRADDIAAMLKKIGASSVDELIAQTVPAAIRLQKPLNLPGGMTEFQYHKHLRAIAAKKTNRLKHISVWVISTPSCRQ
jgi:glycine dehydrogenase